jgi:hypothetical protein
MQLPRATRLVVGVSILRATGRSSRPLDGLEIMGKQPISTRKSWAGVIVIDEQTEEPTRIQSDSPILSDVQAGLATEQPLPMESLTEGLLFIDANKYLDLYRTSTKTGKLTLAALGEQADHIFVTQQVVDEVKRNKIEVAKVFLKTELKELTLQTFNVPGHLFGETEEEQGRQILATMKKIKGDIDRLNKEVDALATDIMERVSQSQDAVSTALTPIFAAAVPHVELQLQRAQQRKERGQPPGKKTGPLGDELTWEQILSRFVGKKKLWIITKDSDYGTFYNGKGFLNQFLYEELRKVSPDAQAFLFDNVVDGIKAFAVVTGVKADKLPTPEQIEEIKKEEESLPPLDWLRGSTGPTGGFGAFRVDLNPDSGFVPGRGSTGFSSGSDTPLALRVGSTGPTGP